MRKATLADLDKIFAMVWDNIEAFASGDPNPVITKAYLANLITEKFGDAVWCDEDCRAAVGYSVAPDGFSDATNCYGTFLVSDNSGAGFKLAKEVLAWVRQQGFIPNFIARPHMLGFYKRVGLTPKEIVFSE